jgi:hypothetical protein
MTSSRQWRRVPDPIPIAASRQRPLRAPLNGPPRSPAFGHRPFNEAVSFPADTAISLADDFARLEMIGGSILLNLMGYLLHFTSLTFGSCSILALWLSFSNPRYAVYALLMLTSATGITLGIPQRGRQ